MKEINDNLIADSVKIQVVLEFNKGKIKDLEGMMHIFSDSLTNRERLILFDSFSMPFTNFQYFEPNRAAFQIILSPEPIDLIFDPEHRPDKAEPQKYQESIDRILNECFFTGLASCVEIGFQEIWAAFGPDANS